MDFMQLAQYWQKLEQTSSRNEMMRLLAELLGRAKVEEVDKVCYLSSGNLGPLYAQIELGLAEKTMVKVIAEAYAIEIKEVWKQYRKEGDLGLVAEGLSTRIKTRQKLTPRLVGKADNSVAGVYAKLVKIAQEVGEGSQERKLEQMSQLLKALDLLSARYVVRLPLGKMRLGFSDKTILDGLSFMSRGDKSAKRELEKAYNVRPDIGRLAQVVREKGIKGIAHLIEPELGVPILMSKAQRMSPSTSSGRDSTEEILLKIGECAVEPKIDGFRLQVHYVKSQKYSSEETSQHRRLADNIQYQISNIKIFSRNLEDVTTMYPDIVAGIVKGVNAQNAILEGEAVAYNPQTNEYLPFQETVQRKRKYEITKYLTTVPLKLIVFDLLLVNGKSLLNESYLTRRKQLEQILNNNQRSQDKTLVLAEMEKVNIDEEKKLEQLFEQAVSRGLEGVMAKRLDAPYQAGARNWNWIKYKRSYSARLADTLDCLVMGYDYGRGKRAAFGIGGFLVGVYDEKNDVFKTVSKIGTGLTDEQWRELKVQSLKLKVKSCPREYEVVKGIEADVWITPELVVEIEADEITKSPVHTAGLALRFPRLKRFRPDKRPEEVTSLVELQQMFKQQRRQKIA